MSYFIAIIYIEYTGNVWYNFICLRKGGPFLCSE